LLLTGPGLRLGAGPGLGLRLRLHGYKHQHDPCLSATCVSIVQSLMHASVHVHVSYTGVWPKFEGSKSAFEDQ